MSFKELITRFEASFDSIDRRRLRSPAVRRQLLIFAMLILIIGGYFSFRDQPDLLDRVNWRPVVLLYFVGVPTIILLSSVEFVTMARMLGKRIELSAAFEVVVIGAAANLLPIPGGAVTRVTALKLAGVELREAAATMAMMTVMWLGLAVVIAGVAVTYLGSPTVGIGASILGAGAVLLSCIFPGASHTRRGAVFASLIVKLLLVLADGGRIYLALYALGFGVNPAQALVFVVAGALGSAVSIMPAGLGVREALAALVAPFAVLAASTGFLAAALSRMVDLAVVGPLAACLAMRRNRLSDAN